MRFLKTLALLFALVISFGAGALTAAMQHWFQPLVTVHIKNLSGLAVSNLVLTSRTGDSSTTTELRGLAAGEETTARLFMAGEGSYKVRATLADGRVLEGGAGYVEAGYTTSELLHADKIESRHRFGL